jgi:hypothetical protein
MVIIPRILDTDEHFKMNQTHTFLPLTASRALTDISMLKMTQPGAPGAHLIPISLPLLLRTILPDTSWRTPLYLADGKGRVTLAQTGAGRRHRRWSEVVTSEGANTAVHLVRSWQARNLPSGRHAGGASEGGFACFRRARFIQASHADVGILRRLLLNVGVGPKALVKQVQGGDATQVDVADMSLHQLLAGLEHLIRLVDISSGGRSVIKLAFAGHDSWIKGTQISLGPFEVLLAPV